MRYRAIIIGLVAAAALNAFCYFNDFVLRQSHLVGSYLPLPVYGGLLIVVLAVNPLIAKTMGKRWGFSGKELALVMAIMLSACYVPGRGLMHYFTTLQILPHYYAKTTPSWQSQDIINQVPKQMLVDVEGEENSDAFDAFLQGMKNEDGNISLSDIPWSAWKRSLWFWTPLLLSFSIAVIGLALAIHRQWSENEHLSYPIATFASTIMCAENDGVTSIFRKRSFWIGTGLIFFIHMNNYSATIYPEVLVSIPRRFDFHGFLQLMPTMQKGGAWMLFRPTIFFCVIGFAYFLASDVSFSLGFAPFVYCLFAGFLISRGVEVRGGFLSPSNEAFFYAGSYFAMFIMVVYAGRHYYLKLVQNALLIKKNAETDSSSTWGFRVFLFGSILFIIQLILIGLDWQLALLYTFIAVLTFVVLSRVVAETGAFFIHAWFFPCALIWGVMGERALGLRPMIIMMLVSSLLMIDPRESLMPFVSHALKIADSQKINLSKISALAVASVVLAFAVAIPATLYWQYNEGGFSVGDGWTNRAVPRFALNNASKASSRLKAQGVLEESNATSGFSRLLKMSPKGNYLISFALFFALTMGCSFARLRFAKWPIHPVMFVALGTYQSKLLGVSFLLGWFIKMMVNRFGGTKAYQDLKPLMLGLIAGEILGGLVPMICGFLYYWWTGESPVSFSIIAG